MDNIFGLTELVKALNLIIDKLGSLVLVIVATYIIGAVLIWLLNAAARASERYRLLFQGFIPYVKVLLPVCAVIGILVNVLELPREQLVYVVGVAALAIGLSSRETIGSAIAYFSIVWNKPFQIGDRVRIGTEYGQVIDIGLACTKLRTPGDSIVTIPNSVVSSMMTVNTNYGSLQSMADIDFYIANSEDPREVKRILWEAAATSKYFFLEEPIVVLVAQFPYYTRYRVKAYTYDTRTEFKFMSDVTETAKREFSRKGINYAPVPIGELNGTADVKG